MPRPRTIAILLVPAAGLVGLTAAGTAPQRIASAQAPITFATPTVVDPVDLYGEPDLRADPVHPGWWFASGPWGTGTQRSIWNRSTDGGRTFRELHDRANPVVTGGSMTPPGGGDTEIAFDHTGKVYMADLAALQTQKVYTSVDGGGTFAEQALPPVYEDNNGTDRQWISIWDPPNPSAVRSAYKGPFPVSYMTFLTAGLAATLGGETIASSVPGGGGDTSRVGLDYACAPGAMGAALCPHWSLSGDGYTVIDQVTGRVIQAIDAGGIGSGHNKVGVEVLTPGANGYMASAVEHDVADIGSHSSGSIFPVAAMDAQRNAYVVWIAQPVDDAHYVPGTSWQVFYSWSPPGRDDTWSQWSKPRRISSAPMSTGVMPWAIAGGTATSTSRGTARRRR